MYHRKTSAVTAAFALVFIVSTIAFGLVGKNIDVLNPTPAS